MGVRPPTLAVPSVSCVFLSEMYVDEPGVVWHSGEAGAGGRVQGHLWPQNEFQSSLGSTGPCLKVLRSKTESTVKIVTTTAFVFTFRFILFCIYAPVSATVCFNCAPKESGGYRGLFWPSPCE